MDKEQALQKFLEFRDNTGVSRDKAIEIYNAFRLNPETEGYHTSLNGDIQTIQHEEFWNIINTTLIREVYKKDKVQSEIDIVEEEVTSTDYTKLRRETLNYKNKLSFERRAFNKKLNEINSLEELNQELIKAIKKIPLSNKEYNNTVPSNNGIGLICISDTHFNELIKTSTNEYNFKIASKRLKKLATTAINHFKDNGINQVVVTLLGDLLNSDRRQSEYMNMVTNRSKAMVLGFYLLRQFIEELSLYFNITVTSVSGNESRVVGEEFDTSEELATYNYDYTIHQFLKVAFENCNNVNFIDGNFGEKIININGSNVLLTHGVNLKSDLEKSVAQTFGRYSSIGITLDYLLCGHLHSARVGDTCARCGCLCGGNSYSEGALNLTSRASQLIGIFYKDKSKNIMNVDLQNVDTIDGYEIINELESYNSKSENKKNKFLVHNI